MNLCYCLVNKIIKHTEYFILNSKVICCFKQILNDISVLVLILQSRMNTNFKAKKWFVIMNESEIWSTTWTQMLFLCLKHSVPHTGVHCFQIDWLNTVAAYFKVRWSTSVLNLYVVVVVFCLFIYLIVGSVGE